MACQQRYCQCWKEHRTLRGNGTGPAAVHTQTHTAAETVTYPNKFKHTCCPKPARVNSHRFIQTCLPALTLEQHFMTSRLIIPPSFPCIRQICHLLHSALSVTLLLPPYNFISVVEVFLGWGPNNRNPLISLNVSFYAVHTDAYPSQHTCFAKVLRAQSVAE